MSMLKAPITRSERDLQRIVDAILDIYGRVGTLDADTTTTVGAAIDAADAKGSLADNDRFAILDSAASDVLKTSLWSVIKSTLAAATMTWTNKTFDANGTGNVLSNIETADFAANVVDVDDTLAADSDTRIPSQQAVKAYVDGLSAGGLTQLATWTFSSGTTSVPFTGLSQDYFGLYIAWSSVSFTGPANSIRLRISVDNGSNYLSGASDYYNGTTAATGIVMGGSPASGDTVSGSLTVLGYGAAVRKLGNWILISSDSADNQAGTLSVSSTSAINAVQFTGSGGGTFDGGTITIYGMR